MGHFTSFLDSGMWKELLIHRVALREREIALYHHIRSLSDDLCPPPLNNKYFPDLLTDIDGDGESLAEIGGEKFHQRELEGLNGEQMCHAIGALAQFHAFSLAKGVYGDTGYGDNVPLLSHLEPQNELALKEWLIGVLCSLPECDYFLRNERALRNFCHRVPLDWTNTETFSQFYPFEGKKLNAADIPIVLCHGNFCAGNIQFLVGENCADNGALAAGGSPLATFFINWSLAHRGFGMSDLAFLFLSSVNSSIRLHNMDDWMELYTSKFEQYRREYWKGGAKRRKRSTTQLVGLRVESVKRMMGAQFPIQLMRVLPKLALEYRKLVEEDEKWRGGGGEENGQKQQDGAEGDKIREWRKCMLRGRMVGGFEMVRKQFEK